MRKKGRKDKKPRFRRTKKEIRRGLTPEQARLERAKPAPLKERILMVDLLRQQLNDKPSEPEADPELVRDGLRKETRANPDEVIARIRRIAQEEVNRDPLLCSRSR